MLQYGRQNIESVRKRNGILARDPNKDLSTEEECESPTVTEKDSTITSPKMQNGSVSNSVIARSKDLILVPEPEMQNHKNHVDESSLGNNHESSVVDDKEVIFGGKQTVLPSLNFVSDKNNIFLNYFPNSRTVLIRRTPSKR